MRNFTPQRALQLSIAAAVVTIALKTGAWWLTGSVGYLSDAAESIVNLIGASFALAMVSYARVPADEDHQYGHGKAEYFSAALEGAMIFVAAAVILFFAAERLIHPKELGHLGMGTALSVAASVVNFIVARVLLQVGRAHRSLALEADSRHLMTDVWTTAGVVVGVALASATGQGWIDPAIAAAVAINILREGFHLMHRSVGGLMDRVQDEDDVGRIESVLRELAPAPCRFANLKTRVSGPARFAQVDLWVPGSWSVARAHALTDEIEEAVRQRTGTRLTTHVEPIEEQSTWPSADGAAPDGAVPATSTTPPAA